MRLNIEVKDGGTPGGVLVEPGESVAVALSWANADGSVRDMLGATVEVRIWTMDRKRQATYVLTDPALLSIPAADTAAWTPKRNYHCEVWETRGLEVLAGHFVLTLGQ